MDLSRPGSVVDPINGSSASVQGPGAGGESGSVYNSQWPAQSGQMWLGGGGCEFGGGGECYRRCGIHIHCSLRRWWLLRWRRGRHHARHCGWGRGRQQLRVRTARSGPRDGGGDRQSAGRSLAQTSTPAGLRTGDLTCLFT